MNNQSSNDLTQYSLKCASILGDIFESVNNYCSTNSEKDKIMYENKLNENITNFELTLDSCYVDVNESIYKIAKVKYEKKNLNNNSNILRQNENNQSDSSLLNEEKIPDEKLIEDVIKKISNIKLQI